ncbi:MAG: autotransporter domain-containing protein, partial [Terrimicrobiaceae bacterium]
DFTVSGPVTTGTPSENNIINSLIFLRDSSLQVFNNLTVTSGNFTVGSGRATIFGGNVLTPGDFNKVGAGALIVNSNFGVGGAANIQAGALFVNRVFSVAQGLTVFQNALLGGSGLINGNVFNNGTVAPGNSVGTLTINGNYSQSSSGTFQLEIASLSSFDRLLVSGNASLAGTLQVLSLGKRLKYGQQYAFLQAGSISGEFDEIVMPNPASFRGRFLTNSGTGSLLVAPTSYTLVAETPNQRRVAKALDSYIPARGNDREVVSIALDLQAGDQYPAAFDQIAPTFHESLANISIEQAFAQTQLLNQRMSSIRLGAAGFQAISIDTEPLIHDKDGKKVVDSKDLKSEISNGKSPAWSLWAQGNGIFAKVTNVSQVPNYRFDGGGVLFGADYTFGDHSKSNIQNSKLTTGVFGGYQGAYADYNSAGRTSINSALFGGYASYTRGGFYADGVVAGGYNNYNARRAIEFSTIDRTARSSQNGGQFSAALNLGYDWEIGKFTLGPIAGVQYTYVGIAPFTESGADSLNLGWKF